MRALPMSATITPIQWTETTWNPVRGCAIVSPGCINCYAMRQAHRFSGPGKPYVGLTKQTERGPQWTGTVVTVEDALREPLSWRRPRKVFVNSMSDLFHDDVPFTFVDKVFAVMALTNRHIYQILTKRPQRMRSYLNSRARSATYWKKAVPEGWSLEWMDIPLVRFPLPNVWIGVSVENQKYADARIPILLETPAALRFISAEPLLGPVDFRRWLGEGKESRGSGLQSGARRGTADRHRHGGDLAAGEASGWQARHSPDYLRPDESGEAPSERLSDGSRDVGRPAALRAGASLGVVRASRNDSRRQDREPSERGEVRESSVEPGTGDALGASDSRAEGARQGSTERSAQQQREAQSESRRSNQEPSTGGGIVEVNREGLRDQRQDGIEGRSRQKVDWIICGGESGHGARICHVQWIRGIVAQCRAEKVACFVKQLGSRVDWSLYDDSARVLTDTKGGNVAEWPADLRVRDFPR